MLFYKEFFVLFSETVCYNLIVKGSGRDEMQYLPEGVRC